MTMLTWLLANRRGGSAVEIALAAPILFALLFGVVEFGRAYWMRTALQFAAEESARYAMANTTASETQIGTFFRSNLSGIDSSTVNVQVSSETVAGVPYKIIVGRIVFSPISFLSVGNITLEGRARVPVVT
jgi:Flp pilus assembly protein TadG